MMIPVPEASKITGFADRTIRRWISQGLKHEQRLHNGNWTNFVDLDEVKARATKATRVKRDSKRPSSVPNRILAPFLKVYFEQQNNGHAFMERKQNQYDGDETVLASNGMQYSAAAVLAEEAGVGISTIYKIMLYPEKNSRFETVDKILTAMDRNYLWHSEPELRQYYEAA